MVTIPGCAVYQVARCQVLNGDEEDAIVTMERVLEDQPDNESYVGFLKSLRKES